MTFEGISVEFSGLVREELGDSVCEQLRVDLTQLFDKTTGYARPRVLVPRLFSGYSHDYDVKVVLAVEVTLADGYERHIVKLGPRKKVEKDFRGWQECTTGRMVASRIFAPVRKVDLGQERVAVMYRDAYSLFGPEEQINDAAPVLLEQAIFRAVQDEEPDTLSAQRAISHVFTDLGVWFYRNATENAGAAIDFYSKHLRLRKKDAPADNVLSCWQEFADRMAVRRHAVWVLCGRDAADADPVSKPARYLDPVDYVSWAMNATDGKRIPPTLVGRAHGDLHARNILVGIRRGEVQYPAVFDYGDMGNRNVVAWDFAKLETELKVRMLSSIVGNESVFRWLLEKSGLRANGSNGGQVEPSIANARRADRMAAFFAFEELLTELSSLIEDERDVDRVRDLTPPPTGVETLDRMLGIILRVRQEAAYWAGFKHPKRHLLWKDELHFALGVYGLLNVRWDYSAWEREAALISSGVALASMPCAPSLLRESIDIGVCQDGIYPSYRVPLAFCYDDWKHKRFENGNRLAESLVVLNKKNERNYVTKTSVRKSYQHAIPLVGQALLLQLEVGNIHAVEPVLEEMRGEATTFQDYEMLARIGRVYKDAGDRRWETEIESGNEQSTSRRTRPPSLQMYDKALEVYSDAYELTEDWYVGINAATLALLVGKTAVAEDIASRVAVTCADKLDEGKKDRFWLHATEGEAAIILDEDAVSFYESALSELSPGQWGMADSAYRQVIRLWRFFGSDGDRRVGPILELFESSQAQESLTRNFLARTWSDK